MDGEEYDVGALEFRALPSQPTRELINNEVLETLTQPVLSCAVCDWLLLCTDPKPRHVTLAEVPSRHLLKPPPELPPLLKAQYCPHPQVCPGPLVRLHCILYVFAAADADLAFPVL